MNDMPMFDDPVQKPPAPKKPGPKPTRKRRRKIAAARKQRVVRDPVPQNTYLTSEVLAAVRMLMNLEIPLRNFAMEVAKALTK